MEFVSSRESGVPHALADTTAVLQILVNLLLNAGDAVRQARSEGQSAGRVEIRVGPGPKGVACHVSDDGTGIPEEVQERIFDPFFTTKPAGEGTGLGLANAARLAEELGGSLRCGTPEGGWRTVFTLQLPAVSGPGQDRVASTQTLAAPAGDPSRGSDA